MTLLRRGAVGLAFTALVAAGLAPAAHADNVEPDTLVGGKAALGDICTGATKAGSVGFVLKRSGAGGGGNVNSQTWGNAALVTVSPGSQPAPLTLGTSSGTTSPGWIDADNNTTADAGDASVSITVASDAALGAQSATVEYSASGPGADGGTTTRPASVTFSWNVVDCAPADSTPPVISSVLTPAVPNGLNGWYTSNVSVDWTVTDPESHVTSAGCEDTTIGTDGIHELTCSASSAGGVADPVTLTIKRDATAPEVTFTGGPADGSSYYYGDAIPGPSTCSATDATSLVSAAGCTVSGGGTAVGTYTQTASARDNAGNLGSATRGYEVMAWTLDGFYRPVVMDAGVVNTVKAGSTVPLKFNVSKGTTPVTADIGARFTTTKVGCDTGDAEDVVDFVTTGSTSLRYDAVAGQWVQNWATPTAGKGSCYRVTMTTADGSKISADFKLK